MTLPAAPTSLGYTSTEWKVFKIDDNSEVEVNDGRFVMPAGDVKIVTTWTKDPEKPSFNLSFKFAGVAGKDYPEEATNLLPDEQTLHENDVSYVPTVNGDIYDGWIFNGWSADGITVDAYSNSFEMPANDVEFVGSWTKKTYKIAFEAGDTAPTTGVTLPSEMEVAWGETVTYPNSATYAGDENWTFLGWTNNAGIEQAGSFEMPKSDITFSGTWANVKYYSISVQNGKSSQSLAVPGEQISIETDLPKHSLFKSWQVTSGGATLADSTSESTTFEMPDEDVEIVADFDSITTYTIHFDANNGEGVMQDITAQAGQAITLPRNAFTRADYEFDGWTINADGTGETFTDGQEVTDLADIEETAVLYAKWKKVTSPDPDPSEPINPTPENPGANDHNGDDSNGKNGTSDANISANDGLTASLLARTGDDFGLFVTLVMLSVVIASCALYVRRRRR